MTTTQQLAAYENLILAHHTGVTPNRFQGDYLATNALTTAQTAVLARMSGSSAVKLASLTNYINLHLAANLGLINNKYDGDFSATNAVATARNAILAIMT